MCNILQNKHKNIRRFFILFILIIYSLFLSYCGEEEKVVIFSESELIRLLSGDSTKSWIRFSIQSNGQDQEITICELRNINTFYIGDSDSLKYSISLNPMDCDGDSTTIEEGIWRIVGDDSEIDIAEKIEFISNEDTVTKNLNEITSKFLNLSWIENELKVVESFQVISPE